MKPRPPANPPALWAAGGFLRCGHSPAARGFTLVELLLSMTILSVLMLVVVNVIGIVQQQWTRSNSRVTAFREARTAFDVLTRNLSQATLNTYWMADTNVIGKDAANIDLLAATGYSRHSELQFVCGKTTGMLTAAAGAPHLYPGHAVFFQAPLGVTRLANLTVNTESMTNLLCGRGYFVAWGDDSGFRPPFLADVSTVKPRFRYRLMEYSPTSESNQIYFDPIHANDLANRRPITDPGRSKAWFKDDALQSQATSTEGAGTRAFTRPVADNIIALVISPQNDYTPGGAAPEIIAPFYEYDSVLVTNPGALPPSINNKQGTQHLLPPLLKITMVSLDGAAGERLAEGGNESQQGRLASKLAPLFHSAANYNDPNSAYNNDLKELQDFLVEEKLNFRVFSTTVVMKQSRWSR